jgi:nanoRNase/pAp phosphatase (c-di-AMP/oligoRNAs hydrolase)
MKKKIFSIAEKNHISKRIREIIAQKNHFLILGHQNPDDDCVGTMVSIALLLRKFSKKVVLSTEDDVSTDYEYLYNICRFNSILFNKLYQDELQRTQAIFICDTPKPSMMYVKKEIAPLLDSGDRIKIEIDHHLEADSDYAGDAGYCLVDEASSAAELVGYLGCKIMADDGLMHRYQIEDIFSRNFVLAILTGMIGDTQMGKFLKTRREKKYYQLFSDKFNELLQSKTIKDTNFSSKEEVFNELKHLSDREEACYTTMMKNKNFVDGVGYLVLDAADMRMMEKEFDSDTIISVARTIADELAEESGKISLVVYYDFPSESDFIQFRARRSHDFTRIDLRSLLAAHNIENGGGHPGAIGFRIKREKITDISSYVSALIDWLQQKVG